MTRVSKRGVSGFWSQPRLKTRYHPSPRWARVPTRGCPRSRCVAPARTASSLQLSLRSGFALLVFVPIDPAPALATEPPCRHVVAQDRRWSVFVVAELLLQDLGDRQHGIETEQVSE